MANVRDVNLNRLAVFTAVVEAGSLTAAAARLGLAKTMVTAHLQRLEKEVGASLVVRTTRQLSVTERGRAFYEASVRILRATDDALTAVAGETAPVQGSLRVSTAVDYGAMVVAPALVALRERYPALQIELVCADQRVDLIADGIDVAVRLGKLPDSNYRALKLGSLRKYLVAAPAFLEKWGVPMSIDALGELPVVALSVLSHPLMLTLQHGDGSVLTQRCDNALLVNTADAARAATLAGGGFALLTDFSIKEDMASGRLVRFLSDWSSVPAGIFAMYPPTSYPSPNVRAFIDLLRDRLAAAGDGAVPAVLEE